MLHILKKTPILIILTTFFIAGAVASDWVNDPLNCPSEYQAQTCSGSDLVCGYSGGITYCYDMSLISAPGSDATSSTSYSGSYDGGYILDCHAYDGSSPFCDNGGSMWCDRDSSCYNVNRITQCNSGKWSGDAGDITCTTCRSGYTYCDGSYTDADGCEIQSGVTSCSAGNNNNVLSNCTCVCDTGYLDCDASGAGAGNGCEIQNGGSCSVGGLSGTYNGCSCEISAQDIATTGEIVKWSGTDAMLWIIQYGAGNVFNFTDENNVSFWMNSSGIFYNNSQVNGGSGGNPFNQDLNTYDSPTFNNITLDGSFGNENTTLWVDGNNYFNIKAVGEYPQHSRIIIRSPNFPSERYVAFSNSDTSAGIYTTGLPFEFKPGNGLMYIDQSDRNNALLIRSSLGRDGDIILQSTDDGGLIFDTEAGGHFYFNYPVHYPGGVLGESIKLYGQSAQEFAVINYFRNKTDDSNWSIYVGGNYDAETDKDYVIEIESINDTSVYNGIGCFYVDDTVETENCTWFRWSDDGGATWDEETILTQHGAYQLNNNIIFGFTCNNGMEGNCNFSEGQTFNFTAVTNPKKHFVINTLDDKLTSEIGTVEFRGNLTINSSGDSSRMQLFSPDQVQRISFVAEDTALGIYTWGSKSLELKAVNGRTYLDKSGQNNRLFIRDSTGNDFSLHSIDLILGITDEVHGYIVNISNTGNITTDGNITANYFFGDGSQLTGITGGGGDVYDQSLNTTDNVTFHSANVTKLRTNQVVSKNGNQMNFTFNVADPGVAEINYRNLGNGDLNLSFKTPGGTGHINANEVFTDTLRTPDIISYSGNIQLNPFTAGSGLVTIKNTYPGYEANLDVEANISAGGIICDGNNNCLNNVSEGSSVWSEAGGIASYDGIANATGGYYLQNGSGISNIFGESDGKINLNGTGANFFRQSKSGDNPMLTIWGNPAGTLKSGSLYISGSDGDLFIRPDTSGGELMLRALGTGQVRVDDSAFVAEETAQVIGAFTASDTAGFAGETYGEKQMLFLGNTVKASADGYFTIGGIVTTSSTEGFATARRGDVVGLHVTGNTCGSGATCRFEVKINGVTQDYIVESGTSNFADYEEYSKGTYPFYAGDVISCYFNEYSGSATNVNAACWVDITYNTF